MIVLFQMTILQASDFSPAESSESREDASHSRARLVCALASVVSLLMFATVIVLRGGFPTPVAALLKIAGISLLVVNVCALGSAKNWLLCGPLLSFLTLIAVMSAGLSPLRQVAWIGATIAIAGGLLCAWNLAMVVARAGLLPLAGVVLLGLFLGLYSESMYWRVSSVHDVVYRESLVAGRVTTDVAEQAAVVNMIATYRLASTALDGLLPLKYHNGSLWIAEGLRRLCGFAAIDFLAYGYGILLIPLYVLAFFGCAGLLRAEIQGEAGLPSFVFWAVSVVAFVGICPFTDAPMLLNFNEIIINSDSFLLAITLSLLVMEAGVRLHQSVRGRGLVLNLRDKVALAIGFPAILTLIGWVKISQIYLLLALAGYLWLRVKWLRSWPFLLGVVLSSLSMVVMLRGEMGANQSSFAPFNFDRIAPEWVPYFFVGFFIWTWLLLVLWARMHGVETLRALWAEIKVGSSIVVELAFVAVISGITPYLLIDFYSPAWKYFTDFQGVLAGLFVIAFWPPFRLAELWQRARDGSLRLTTALLCGLTLTVCGHLLMTTLASSYRMLKRGCETRAVLAGLQDTAWRQEVGQIEARRSAVSPRFANRVHLLDCLVGLGGQSLEQRRGLALYIPKTNRTYWDMRQLGDGATPFIAPALASISMVDGLPEFADIGWARVGWGYPQYKLPSGPEPPSENVARAVEKARADGFRELLVLREGAATGCGIEEIALR